MAGRTVTALKFASPLPLQLALLPVMGLVPLVRQAYERALPTYRDYPLDETHAPQNIGQELLQALTFALHLAPEYHFDPPRYYLWLLTIFVLLFILSLAGFPESSPLSVLIAEVVGMWVVASVLVDVLWIQENDLLLHNNEFYEQGFLGTQQPQALLFTLVCLPGIACAYLLQFTLGVHLAGQQPGTPEGITDRAAQPPMALRSHLWATAPVVTAVSVAGSPELLTRLGMSVGRHGEVNRDALRNTDPLSVSVGALPPLRILPGDATTSVWLMDDARALAMIALTLGASTLLARAARSVPRKAHAFFLTVPAYLAGGLLTLPPLLTIYGIHRTTNALLATYYLVTALSILGAILALTSEQFCFVPQDFPSPDDRLIPLLPATERHWGIMDARTVGAIFSTLVAIIALQTPAIWQWLA